MDPTETLMEPCSHNPYHGFSSARESCRNANSMAAVDTAWLQDCGCDDQRFVVVNKHAMEEAAAEGALPQGAVAAAAAAAAAAADAN